MASTLPMEGSDSAHGVRRSKRLRAMEFISSHKLQREEEEDTRSSISEKENSRYSTSSALSTLSTRARARASRGQDEDTFKARSHSFTSPVDLDEMDDTDVYSSRRPTRRQNYSHSSPSREHSATSPVASSSSRRYTRKSSARQEDTTESLPPAYEAVALDDIQAMHSPPRETSSRHMPSRRAPSRSPARRSATSAARAPRQQPGLRAEYEDEDIAESPAASPIRSRSRPRSVSDQHHHQLANALSVAAGPSARQRARVRVRWGGVLRLLFSRDSTLQTLQQALQHALGAGADAVAEAPWADWQAQLDRELNAAGGDSCVLERPAPLEPVDVSSDSDGDGEAAGAVEVDEEEAIHAILRRRRHGSQRRDSIDVAMMHGLARIRRELTGEANENEDAGSVHAGECEDEDEDGVDDEEMGSRGIARGRHREEGAPARRGESCRRRRAGSSEGDCVASGEEDGEAGAAQQRAARRRPSQRQARSTTEEEGAPGAQGSTVSVATGAEPAVGLLTPADTTETELESPRAGRSRSRRGAKSAVAVCLARDSAPPSTGARGGTTSPAERRAANAVGVDTADCMDDEVRYTVAGGQQRTTRRAAARSADSPPTYADAVDAVAPADTGTSGYSGERSSSEPSHTSRTATAAARTRSDAGRGEAGLEEAGREATEGTGCARRRPDSPGLCEVARPSRERAGNHVPSSPGSKRAQQSSEDVATADGTEAVEARMYELERMCEDLQARLVRERRDAASARDEARQAIARAEEATRTQQELKKQVEGLQAEAAQLRAVAAKEAESTATRTVNDGAADALECLQREHQVQQKTLTKLQQQVTSCHNGKCRSAMQLRVELTRAQRLVHSQKQLVAEITTQNEAVLHEMAALHSQHAEQVAQLEGRMDTMHVQLEGRAHSSTEATSVRMAELEQLRAEAREKHERAEEQYRRVSKELLASEAMVDSLRGELESLAIEHKVLKQNFEHVNANYAKLSSNYERLQSDYTDVSGQFSRAQDESAQEAARLKAALGEVDTLQRELKLAQAALDRGSAGAQDVREQLLRAEARQAVLAERLSDSEATNTRLVQEHSRMGAELDHVRAECERLRSTSQASLADSERLRAEAVELRAQALRHAAAADEREVLWRADREKVQLLSEQLEHSRRVAAELEREVTELVEDLEKAEKHVQKLTAAAQETTQNHIAQLQQLRSELEAARAEAAKAGATQATQTAEEVAARDAEIVRLRSRVSSLEEAASVHAALQQEVDRLRAKAEADDEVRRSLHNQLIDLRGNIRVFCRIRPCAGKADFFTVQPRPPGALHQVLEVHTPSENVYGTSAKSLSKFKFDSVFAQGSTQEELFTELSAFVTSALDGYNTAVFAYGQTGSGKTHTMMGPQSCFDRAALGLSPERGVIPRAVEQIFSVATKKAEANWRFCVKATFFEIYNDQVRDLLVDMPRATFEFERDDRVFFVDDEVPPTPTQGFDPSNCRIALTSSGNVFVPGATIVPVFSAEQVYQLIHFANSNRSVGATAMNARSSRSHSIVQLHIQARFLGLPGKLASTVPLSSTISLVDLAGSERLDKSKTNAMGGKAGEQALKETLHINASLSTLTKCIQAIARKSEHVPYRDSKLTYLLKDSLGGTAKTLFFTNIASEQDHLSESLCTLRFAETLKHVEMGARVAQKGNPASNAHKTKK